MHFALRFINKNPQNMSYILICKKQFTLRYVFISKIYRVVLIPDYKRTYNKIEILI